MLKEKILDLQTNEITYRNYTEEEIAEVEKAQIKALEIVTKAETEKAARQAIFDRLGITAEEAAVLGL